MLRPTTATVKAAVLLFCGSTTTMEGTWRCANQPLLEADPLRVS
jgi:hypothetical protein